jgi:hypothetical protein
MPAGTVVCLSPRDEGVVTLANVLVPSCNPNIRLQRSNAGSMNSHFISTRAVKTGEVISARPEDLNREAAKAEQDIENGYTLQCNCGPGCRKVWYIDEAFVRAKTYNQRGKNEVRRHQAVFAHICHLTET